MQTARRRSRNAVFQQPCAAAPPFTQHCAVTQEKKLTPEGELAQAWHLAFTLDIAEHIPQTCERCMRYKRAPCQCRFIQPVQVQQILSEIVSSQEKMLVDPGMFRLLPADQLTSTPVQAFQYLMDRDRAHALSLLLSTEMSNGQHGQGHMKNLTRELMSKRSPQQCRGVQSAGVCPRSTTSVWLA